MHCHDITVDGITKIEGHAKITLTARGKEVKNVKLCVSENKRFFEEACIGKQYSQIPYTVSRICGTCSAAHQLGSIEALEKALAVTPSRQTLKMRNLLMYGELLRDHGMFLYYFFLPDVFGKESIFAFGEKEHEWLHDSMDVRNAGIGVSDWVGGRSIHPTTLTVGGFTALPNPEKKQQKISELEKARPKVLKLVELLQGFEKVFERKANNICIKTPKYGFLEGKISDFAGSVVEEADYEKHLKEIVLPYTNSSEFEFEGLPYRVGALSRLNLNKSALHKKTQTSCSEALKLFPSKNIFHNPLAEAIELVHCIDASVEMLSGEFEKEELPKIEPISCGGVGAVEAPRGTLYYWITLNNAGRCTNARIIIPTAQNTRCIEEDIKAFAPQLMHLDHEQIRLGLESIVRSYDPCMSCATHFLKLKLNKQ